jgi:AcrR family transcriptional regulator
VPRLWTSTIDAHRRAVIDAILDATAAAVDHHGLTGVKMSHIAEDSGIGRATLYKYFPDVESILTAWHERQVQQHLDRLAEVRDAEEAPLRQLRAVLEAYAHLSRHDHSETAAALHRGDHAHRASEDLQRFVGQIIDRGVTAGELRADTPADELAAFCIHAVGASRSLTSPSAVHRLVEITISGIIDPKVARSN